MHDFGSDKHPSDFDSASDNLHMVDCGFCSKDSGECVCREISIGLNQLIESSSATVPDATSLLGDLNMASTSTAPGTLSGGSTSSAAAKPSILDDLPPVQPGVPLRLRRSRRSGAGEGTNTANGGLVHLTSVPQLVSLQPVAEPSSRPVCSGDPSNCAACADDPFGRAFCTALASGGVCRDNNCMRCPKSDRPSQTTASTQEGKDGKGKGRAAPMDVDVGPSSGVGLGMGIGMSMETGMLLCCGDPKLCGGGGCGANAPSSPLKTPSSRHPLLHTTSSSSGTFNHPQSHTLSVADTDMEGDRDVVRLPSFSGREEGSAAVGGDTTDQEVATNDAWARLKAHPNIAFADLALLADVVARRTKCTGPRVILSPSPEREVEPRRDETERGRSEEAVDEDGERNTLHPPPMLVPHDALMRCGRERLMRVQAEGVRDALAMLDIHRST
jgi:AP-1-like factor